VAFIKEAKNEITHLILGTKINALEEGRKKGPVANII
jgi:hypothetical protein